MPDSSTVVLNLWKRHLGRVPDVIWEQTELKSLILADNDLKEISARVGGMRHLRMLDLGHNELTQLPESLGEITGLSDFLYLHDNRLTSLPDSLSRLKTLRYLNISENAFQSFPIRSAV